MSSYLKHFIQTVVFALMLAVALSACATSPSTDEPSFEVQLIPGRSLQIVQGSSTEFMVQLNRNGFTDPITVTAFGFTRITTMPTKKYGNLVSIRVTVQSSRLLFRVTCSPSIDK